MAEPKKGLALLLSPGKGEGGDDEEETEDGFDDAAQAVFDAAKADDAEAFAVALKRAIYACKHEE